MNRIKPGRGLALASLCCLALGLGAGRLSARPQGAEATAVALPLPSQPPKGAVVLLSDDPVLLRNAWVQRYTTNAPKWTLKEGVVSPAGTDITSKQEFGDCFLHVEFRTPVDADGKPVGHGNAGIGLQGRYEIQITHGGEVNKNSVAALYDQTPAMRDASKKPGEWQTFDIIFRAPRFDAAGKVTEKPRATVFQNGVIVQNNAEFTGMTGIQYGQYKEMTKTGPLVLQGDHDPVQYRNLWLVPM